MRPNDENGNLPTAERPFRVLIIAGSDRRQYNCPGVDSKARTLMLQMADRLPQQWEIDYEDLGNVYGRARIQSCNACVSTSMALCVWPCNCYEKNNKKEPDLMWDLDMYARLDLADAWAIIGPINWYAPTSNLKLMFDRLVCTNGGNPCEDTINHKDPELAMKAEHSPEWQMMSLNHLEDRTAAFFCYELVSDLPDVDCNCYRGCRHRVSVMRILLSLWKEIPHTRRHSTSFRQLLQASGIQARSDQTGGVEFVNNIFRRALQLGGKVDHRTEAAIETVFAAGRRLIDRKF